MNARIEQLEQTVIWHDEKIRHLEELKQVLLNRLERAEKKIDALDRFIEQNVKC